MSEVLLSDRRQAKIAENHAELLGVAAAWRKSAEAAASEVMRLRAELDDSTETSRKAVELMADAVAEVVTLRAQLAEMTGERDRLRAALVEIYATATQTLADPPCADMAALIMICTIFEALFAQPEPKPEAGSVQP